MMSSPETEEETDPCVDQDGLVIDPIAPIASEWNGAMQIGGHGTVTVHWCATGVVTIASITLGFEASGALEQVVSIYEPDSERARLTYGDAINHVLYAPVQPSSLVVVVAAIREDGSTLEGRANLESIENPERLALRTACESSRGIWGRRGLQGSEICDRPTPDAGQRCISDADCEGPCIHAGSEPFDDASVANVEVPTCTTGYEPHLLVGRCHDRTIRFGCHPRLPSITVECVAPVFRQRAHMICVD